MITWSDGNGGIVSDDWKVLIKGPNDCVNYVIPKGVEHIAPKAFSGSGALSIDIPNTVKSIGTRAFEFCDNLYSLEIPESVEKIYGNPFVNYYYDLYVDSPHFVLEDDVLYTADKRKVVACLYVHGTYVTPPGVEEIGEYAFAFQTQLKEVVLTENVRKISDNAFYSCCTLEKVTMKSVTQIGKFAFYGCFKLAMVEFGERLNMIDEYAFAMNMALEEVELPRSLKRIGIGVFMCCMGLRSLKYHDLDVDRSHFICCFNLPSINGQEYSVRDYDDYSDNKVISKILSHTKKALDTEYKNSLIINALAWGDEEMENELEEEPKEKYPYEYGEGYIVDTDF